MLPSYIGVTGFMNRGEVDLALAQEISSIDRRWMIGVLASEKTLAGRQNSLPHKFPRREDIAGLFSDNPLALNMIHFFCNDQTKMLDLLNQATNWAGDNLHGFQINMVFPCHLSLAGYRQNHPEKILILQVSPQYANISAIISALYHYEGIIDGIIFDCSRGQGKELDVPYTIGCLSQIKEAFPDLGLVIGGGLHAGNIAMLKPILLRFPDISIDAEGKLRHDNDHDHLNRQEMVAYQRAADALFHAVQVNDILW